MSQHPDSRQTDSLYWGFHHEYLVLADSLSRELGSAGYDDALASSDDSELAAVLQRHGFNLNSTEGNKFVDEDIDYLARTFARWLTPAMRDYLSLRAADYKVKFSEDAALLLSWDSLADRLANWDALLARYPDFAGRSAAKYWRQVYLETYLTGMDNSRTFTDEGTLDPDVQRSYRRFLQEHPGTASAGVVRGYLAALQVSGYHSDSTVDAFLRANGLKTMLGVQPPIN
jgi:hypothetical protein